MKRFVILYDDQYLVTVSADDTRQALNEIRKRIFGIDNNYFKLIAIQHDDLFKPAAESKQV